jgi:carboxypeptidase Taq
MSAVYAELLQALRGVATLTSVANLLGWDQEAMMPPKAGATRAEELALISKLAHERAIEPRIGELLAECEANSELNSDSAVAANLREIRRDYDRARKLPSELVAELQETGSRAVEAWKGARADSNFPAFEPWLRRLVELCRHKAECYGAPQGGELYDALLEEY